MGGGSGFGAELRRLREDRGLSLARLAALTHYSKGYLSNVENARKPASLELARRLDAALGADGGLLALADAREEPACPYRGLAAFEPEDADWFFGRGRMTANLVGRVTDCVSGSLPLAVFGVSGAGKSSLLRAGLVSAVTRGALSATCAADWSVLVMNPTARPVNALAETVAELLRAPAEDLREGIDAGDFGGALRAALDGRRLVLVVDQFEEAFAVCEDEAERGAFVAAVCDAARPGPDGFATAVVVLGIRADFYSRCLEHPQLLRAAQDNQFAVDAMSREELVEAITAPARAAGLALEPGLTELLLRDLGVAPGTGHHATYEPGALPLLSHALLATWQQRTDSHLTVAGYQATGGIHGAVATTAEHVYSQLDPTAQQAARQLLLRLIRVSEDGTDARRRVGRDRLEDQCGGRAPAIVAALAAARLLTLDDTTAEITHEALLRAWPRLRDWLAEDRQGLRALDQLAEAADAWETLQHDPGTLFRGTRLALIGEWAAVHRDALSEREERFLQASLAAQSAEQRTTRRRTRRLRQLVGLLTALLMIASVSVSYAMNAEHQAKKQRNIAVARRAAGEAAAMRTANPALSLQLTLAAYRLAPTPETKDTLLGSFTIPYASRLVGHTGDVVALAVSPDSRTAITGSDDRTARLWDITDGHRPRQLAVLDQAAEVKALAFAPGGHVLATASGRTTRLWDISDVRRPRALAVLAGHTNTVKALAFSPDGRTLATASSDHTVRLWNMAEPRRPQPLSTLTGHTSQLAVAFSSDGRTLVTADEATPWVWDISNPRAPQTVGFLSGHTGVVNSAVFSPDGHTVATAGWDHTVRLWDLSRPRSPRALATLTDHSAIVWAVAFSPDGHSLVSSGDGAWLWDVSDTRRPVHTTTVPGLYSAAFTPDGHALVTTDADHTARLVDLRELPLVGHGNVVPRVALSPNGATLATASWDHTVRLWDVTDPRVRRPLATLVGHTNFVRSVSFSPDGRTLASAGDDHTVRLWDVSDPRAPRTVRTLGPQGWEFAAATFSPDGRWLATGTYQKVQLWDVSTRDNPREVAVLDDFPHMIWTVAFSSDSRTMGIGGGQGVTARLYDIGDPRHPRELAFPFGETDTVPSGAFSPDGRMLATVSNDLDNDNLVRLVDIGRLSQPRQLATLTGHTGKVQAVAFTSDGRTLATAANDKTVRVWNIADPRRPKLLATLTGHTDNVTSVVFLPDGHTLATGSNDHTVRLWSTSTNQVATRICDTVHPTITRREWARYFPEITYRPPCGG